MNPSPPRPIALIPVLLIVLHLTAGLGCGPFFRENLLEIPRYIVRSPEFHFMGQFRKRTAEFAGDPEREERACTLEREMAEMESIMAGRIPDEGTRRVWLDDYRELRRGMLVRGDRSLWRVTKDNQKVTVALDERVGRREWPGELPYEVRLYLDGAAHYLDHLSRKKAEDLALARDRWKQVLALAPADRQHRGIWSAWMLFRTSAAKDVGEERRWLGLVRELKEKGSADCQHFAEEATVILHRIGPPPEGAPASQHIPATEHLRALARRQILGHSSGERELGYWASSSLEYSAEEATAISKDDALVGMVTMALVEQTQAWRANTMPEAIQERLGWWLSFFEENPPARSAEFSLLAWAEYSLADFPSAKRWLTLAPRNDTMAIWLRGKIAAMEGRLEESQRLLELAEREVAAIEHPAPARFDPSDPLRDIPDRRHRTDEARSRGRVDQVKGDLALVQIAKSRHLDALETLLGSEHWTDTAYVAERLLSPEEVLTFARRVTPPHPEEAGPSEGFCVEDLQDRFVSNIPGEQTREKIEDRFRYLVARKAAREGWFESARPFYPPALRDAFDHYIEARKRGQDFQLSEAERAGALWKAARMHRSLGMAFFGYEIGPDQKMHGGSFDVGDMAERRRLGYAVDYWESPESITPEEREERRYLLPVTPDERWSDRHYGPGSRPRFHYRHDAAQLAWNAAALLPDNNELGARILCAGGAWLKNRDASAADRFYQALVSRHSGTELGKEAEGRRWFPEINTDFNDRFPSLR